MSHSFPTKNLETTNPKVNLNTRQPGSKKSAKSFGRADNTFNRKEDSTLATHKKHLPLLRHHAMATLATPSTLFTHGGQVCYHHHHDNDDNDDDVDDDNDDLQFCRCLAGQSIRKNLQQLKNYVITNICRQDNWAQGPWSLLPGSVLL